MRSKHSAAINARMRRTGETYYVARRAYLAEMGMPDDPPSQKGAKRKAARLLREEQTHQDAAIFAEYGADVLGVEPPPEVAPLIEAGPCGRPPGAPRCEP